jgi:hypothetical protein
VERVKPNPFNTPTGDAASRAFVRAHATFLAQIISQRIIIVRELKLTRVTQFLPVLSDIVDAIPIFLKQLRIDLLLEPIHGLLRAHVEEVVEIMLPGNSL